MELEELKNPSKLFIAFIDSLGTPVCVVDNFGNVVMNEPAKILKKTGFDFDIYSLKASIGSPFTVFHKNKKYTIDKKDMNHGTNTCVCTLKQEDETVSRLKESSAKLLNVLSSL